MPVGGQQVRSRSVGSWFAFALFVQLFFAMPVGTNPASRWVALCALSEDATFQIDAYQDQTIDWSRGPDGHYYSNKAPGPLLLGYPVFKALDLWQTRGVSDRAARDRIRYEMRGPNLRILSFLFQVVPFLLLAFLWWRKWREWGVSERAREMGLIALLMGTTATVFLNSYFGHGMTAIFLLALAYALVSASAFWAAFFFGMALLCEYSVALLLLPLLVFWARSFLHSSAKVRWLAVFLGGALVPGVLWCGYHFCCFGGIFRIANQFQNPLFVDFAPGKTLFWGILSLPDPHIAWRLFFGPDRGLFWTQPWVVALVVLWVSGPPPFKGPGRWESVAGLVAFTLFFILNAAFNGWHGGSTPGPRYLAPILPLLAFALVFTWDQSTALARGFLSGSLLVSVGYQILFLSTYGLPPQEDPIWQFYWKALWGDQGGTTALRLALGWPIAGMLFYRSWVSTRSLTS